jgi:cob(I)alamin adenosyltransferase
MSITTKKGDKGLTSLYLKGKVRKDNIRIEVCGSLDELSSFLGLSKSLVKKKKLKELFESIQKDLSLICTEVSTLPRFINRLSRRLNKSSIERLEMYIDKLEKKYSIKKCFYLTGGNIISSFLCITRAIARRTERRVVTLKNKRKLKNPYILMYLNRLSDLLYILARIYQEKTTISI